MIRYRREGGDLVATSDIAIAADRMMLSARLVGWPDDVPDPGGLRGAPVVVVPDADLLAIAAAGIRRSGRIDPLIADARSAGLGSALRAGAEATVLAPGRASLLEEVRVLGGRPLPALPLTDPRASAELLDGCRVDLDLALPSGDDAMRSAARAALATAHVAAHHHVVEVDPRPAFDELDTEAAGASLTELAAAAAGVLAGRVAAGTRRWRATR